MRGINFQSLLKNWDVIIDKLCDEITTFDVLTVIRNNLARKSEELQKNNYDNKKIKNAIQKLDEVLKLIDPEQF